MSDNLHRESHVALPDDRAQLRSCLTSESSSSGMSTNKIDPVKHWWVVS